MSWSAPRTWVAGDVLTAAQLNQDIRDNINLLLPTSAFVLTDESTASTSFTDLATSGPAVTVTTGTKALVELGCGLYNTVDNTYTYMGVGVTGASTITAATNDSSGWSITHLATTGFHAISRMFLITGLTAGSNVFTAKYKVASNTGHWFQRTITVWPYNS